jgi:leader peptidase (prepilin peptidase)/N-methyltransferase
MFGGACLGAALLLPILLLGRIFGWQQCVMGNTEENETMKVAFGSQVPFGPMLALGGLIYFLGFSGFVDAYFMNFINVFFAL